MCPHGTRMMKVQVWQICLFDCLISQGYKSGLIVTFIIRKEIAFTQVLFSHSYKMYKTCTMHKTKITSSKAWKLKIFQRTKTLPQMSRARKSTWGKILQLSRSVFGIVLHSNLLLHHNPNYHKGWWLDWVEPQTKIYLNLAYSFTQSNFSAGRCRCDLKSGWICCHHHIAPLGQGFIPFFKRIMRLCDYVW